MPRTTEFGIDHILNHIFVSATASIAIGNSGASGDANPVQDRTPQNVFNLVFDETNNLLRM